MNGMMETSELNGGNLVTMTLDQTTTTKTSETLNKASTGLHAIRETTNKGCEFWHQQAPLHSGRQ